MRPPSLSKKELQEYFITQEQWERVPLLVKWHIFFILFWEVEIRQGVYKLGLRLGGQQPPRGR
jgi:hypothetical protein